MSKEQARKKNIGANKPLKKNPEAKGGFPKLQLLLVVVITAICLSPMLKNQFTNWDDEKYVTKNILLQGPDWKGIWSEPVVSNYHPLTVVSLALNYQASKLAPYSYFFINLILHLINTVLVFYLAWKISEKKLWVASLTALIFGIHPMHVESVAWISERKDVLYTFFFLLGLLVYWKFLNEGKFKHLVFCFLLFVLSLLSKPAAIIFPLVMLVLDYWKGRTWNMKVLLEKIPFFLLAALFVFLTLRIQSKTSIATLDIYPVWSRLFFACYVIMTYALRFVIPYPLSAFHPYPSPDDLGMPVMLSPLFIVATAVFLWYKRKNKVILFGTLFFVVNLLLVLQIVAIGNTITSERYTYVPYIGLAFMLALLLHERLSRNGIGWIAFVALTIVFGSMTYARTHVWRDSETLWTDVISHYPDAPVARTNRSNIYCERLQTSSSPSEINMLIQKALEDCNAALKTNPKHVRAYEDRGIVYLRMQRYDEARADGDSLIKFAPWNKLGYTIRGTAYQFLTQYDKAIEDFTKCLQLFPGDDFSYGKRGMIYFNYLQKYPEALADFNEAIRYNPRGQYYHNRSLTYFRLGDIANAKADMYAAEQRGEVISSDYKKMLGL